MERLIISISGCVQGVGFRPFVYRLASQHHLCGSISNTTAGVMIDVQGEGTRLVHFQEELVSTKPKGAMISEIKVDRVDLHEASCFEIKTSLKEMDPALALLPDTAMCEQCLGELFDPDNRRYHYPFLHCTTCGPRFSLFLSIPFDRANTTMTDFCMCPECNQEYEDPANRRFYSQTNCCPQCGPKLKLLDSKGKELTQQADAVNATIQLLKQGKIVCMKNTGGFQLLVDGTNDEAVKRLRTLKHRAGKPFALLMPNIGQIHQAAHLCPTAEKILTSPAAPIVLLKKRDGMLDFGRSIAPSVACDSPYFGMMLPHNALQYLLLNPLNRPLVATSGNISGSPLCITEEEALSQLSSVADAFLVHNRTIKHFLDDSIVHIIADQPVLLRRARGYIPYAMTLPESISQNNSSSYFAAGGHQKSSFAFTKKNLIYLSQHIGDLEEAKTCMAYDREVEKWEKLLSIIPTDGISDNHPNYYTSHYLQRRHWVQKSVQHHQAHVWAGMIDNQLHPPFLGVAWDGTGFGDDGILWGGETFNVTTEGMHRLATLFPFRLPGGEKAVREPRRSALGTLYSTDKAKLRSCEALFNHEELAILLNALNKDIQSPLCSSIGRLFDAVSALIGCCAINHFEGQAALTLEAVAYKTKQQKERYRLTLLKEEGLRLMDWRFMLTQIAEDKENGVSISEIAWAFHEALAQCIVDLAKLANYEIVLLTGGVMQNKLLVEMAVAKLQKAGFCPVLHRNIPPNDGGLAVGQVVGILNLSKP